MLSSSVVKNSSQASHYFSEKDNYYTQEEGFDQSEWWGKGANKLSLSGKVDDKQFTELLQGRLPDGEQLGKIVDGTLKHRPGWDLTFSAPKSISIMALIGGDKRLIEAHRDAVKVALAYIERSNSQARIKTSEGMTYQNTSNLVASLYHHDLSRAKDPQLHTHSVIMNMTERKDGKWRSLASSMGRYGEEISGEVNGFIERVRHHNRFLSKLYETELAFRVKQLGYDIKTNAKTGIFEISDVPKDVIQFFSKRRSQIENQLDEKGLSGGKAAAFATLNTRDAKEKVDREELRNEWEHAAKELKFDFNKIIENTYNKKNEIIKDKIQEPGKMEVDAIIQATKSLSTFQTTFTLEEVVTIASTHAIGNGLSFESLLNAIESQIVKGELISLASEQGKTSLMAKSTLADEKRLLTQIKQDKLLQPTVDAFHLINYLSQHSEINSDHHPQLKSIFDNDRMVLIEGQQAKNSLVEPIIKIAKSVDLEVAILSPTLINSKQLANDLKQQPQTFWEKIKAIFVDATPKHYSVLQFLSQHKNDQLASHVNPDILIVDNAHLLSTHQKANLAEWNSKHNTKLILLGNNKTLLPQQTGSSLDQVIDYGVKTISINDQSNKSSALKNINIQDAINKFSDRIVEVKDNTDRHVSMAKHYCRLTEPDRKNSWLMSRNKEVVERLNLITHSELVNNKMLGKSIHVSVLIPVFLSEEKAAHALSYEKDQVVRFNESFPSLSVTKGEYLKVIQNNKKTNRVILQKVNGESITWRPDKAGGTSGKIELFNEKKREFAVGETILFHRSNKVQHITKGERFTITDIKQTRIKLKNSSGHAVLIDSTKPYHRHLDYGYAATAHQIAHEKAAFLISDLPAKSFTTDQRQFYQVISQPKEAWVYTDSHQRLVTHLENKTGNKLTAHETLKNAEEMNKNLHSLHAILEKQIIAVNGNNKSNLSRTAVEAVEYAMHHLAEREAGFTHKQLMQTAMQHVLGEVTQDTLTRATVAMEQAGILLRGRRGDGTLWTTADAVKMEREILAICTQDQGKFQPIANENIVTQYCEASKLNPEQTAAVKAITQNKDRVMAVQGHPGTGKTHMLATVADVLAAKNLITSQGYEILGLAPTHTAVEELRKRGLSAQTLDSFIANTKYGMEQRSSSDKSKLILIIDEASMVSNRRMLEGLQIAYQFGCRAIPTGDNRQIQSIEGGKPFDLIQNSPSIETVKLTEIKRQKDTVLKKAVKETMEYDFKAAFTTLKNSIIEIPHQKEDIKDSNWQEVKLKNRQERVSALVKDYFSFDKSERENIQVITPGHDDRALANTLIREQLKQEGILKNNDTSVPVLTAASLTQVERSHITNFNVGDILRFGKRESNQIKSGDYLAITEINQDQSLIKLKCDDGREVAWQVPKFDKNRLSKVEVFKKESRDIQVGDVIRWSRSDKEHGLLSSEAAKIINIVKNKVTVELANKELVTLDANDPKHQHWDHGYASTVYAVQGKTKDIVLAHLESFRQNLTTQAAFLVSLTRSVNIFRLYTDNTNNLLKTIEKNHGNKLSSLEVIGEYPDKDKNKNQITSVSKKKSTTNDLQSKKEMQFKDAPPKFDRYSIDRIKEGVNREAEKIATDILGNPKLKGSHFIKFGSNQGSLSVTTKGEKQGWWNDFGGEGGGKNMLSFIQKQLGLNRQEAIQYAAKWLGIYPSSHNEFNENKIIKPNQDHQKQDKQLKQEQKAKIEFARKIAEQSQPISGTIVEKYLKEQRAISMKEYPEDIMFHPGIYSKLNGKTYPAMLVLARDKTGKIQAAQATYLDPNTATKVDKSDVKIQKQTFGVMKGAVVTIKGHKGAPTLVAEGTETGLSLAQAISNATVKITLSKSNFVNIEAKSLSEKVVFCLDNDGKDIKSDKVITSAVKRLVESNKQVSIMVPTAVNNVKQDYNDVLKNVGIDPIQNDLKNAISSEKIYGNMNRDSLNFNSAQINILKGNNQISDKEINNFAKQIARDTNQTDLSHVHSKQTEPIKTITKLKDIEREI